jgi:hypothetical protein
MKTVVRKRRPPMVSCAWIDKDQRDSPVRSCEARIPFAPKKPCPSCGKTQTRASAPQPPADAVIISESTVLIDEDLEEIVAAQILGEVGLASRVAQQLRHVTWQSPKNEGRLSGISVKNQTFGFAAAQPLRSRYGCSRCFFDRDFPEVSETLHQIVSTAERKFMAYAPGAYRRTSSIVMDNVAKPWLISGTPWTSGVINNTAALPYHRDSGNIAGSWSAMFAARSGLDGGYLHLVDYDVWLSIPNGSYSIFDGQSVLHGVSPFIPTSHDAYRYTIVTYAKSGMKRCHPDPDAEVQLAAQRAAESDERKAKKLLDR